MPDGVPYICGPYDLVLEFADGSKQLLFEGADASRFLALIQAARREQLRRLRDGQDVGSHRQAVAGEIVTDPTSAERIA